jgi:hypothetical protein
MEVAQQVVNTYVFNKRDHVYTISDKKGRDLFYFNSKQHPFFNAGYPSMISINPLAFNDRLIDYCFNQIHNHIQPDEKVEFYLMKLFTRALSYKFCNDYFIDENILDARGKYKEVLHRHYVSRFMEVFYNRKDNVKINHPYTASVDCFIFKFYNLKRVRMNLLSNSIEVSREVFEFALVNESLKSAYVQEYHPDSRFFHEFNDDFYYDNAYASSGWLMTLEDEIQMFFFNLEPEIMEVFDS